MTPLEHLRLAMADMDAYYKKQGIFQDRFGFGKKPALIVIDMAYGWTDASLRRRLGPARPGDCGDPAAVPAARARGIPILYTTSPYCDKPAAQVGRGLLAELSQVGPAGLRDRRARSPLPGERVHLQGLCQRLRRHAARRAF